MPWQLALAIMVVGNVSTRLVQRHYAKNSTVPSTIPSAASYLFGVIPVGLIAGFLLFPHDINWSWWLVMLMALCGASMAIAGATGFRAAKHLTVAANMTIGRMTGLTTILLGWVILGEGLTTWQLLGGALLMVAAFLAIWAPAKTTTGSFQHLSPSVVLLALIAAVALAIGLVTEKAILGHTQIGGVFLVSWTAQTLAMTLLALKDCSKQHLTTFLNHEFKWSALMGTVNGLTGVFYIYALSHANNISLITTLLAITLPATILGAYLFLHEREHHKVMWLSLGVSLVGLVVSSL